MFTQSLISLVALSSVFLPTLAAPGPAWIRRQQDAQSSLTLDPATIQRAFEQDGQGAQPDPGQVRSATSSNNFINFCLGPLLANGTPLTNGKQVTGGSCNQTPMGRIISLDKAPRSKFVFPKNGDESIAENQPFTVKMKILNMETGNFVNAQANYYAAPQQANGDGILIGHSHVVIEKLPSLQSTEPLDPNTFSFFKGLNNAAQNDILTADVTAGLKAGVYRICSINTAANHQPALVSNAQHGSLDDCSYFTVKGNGSNASVSSTSVSTTATSASSSTSATANTTQTASATQSTSTNASVTDSTSTKASVTDSSATQSTSTTDSSSTAQSTSTTDSQSKDSSSAQPTSTTDSSSAQPTSTTDSSSAAQTTSADSSSAQSTHSNADSNSAAAPSGSNGADSSSAQSVTTSTQAEAPSSSTEASAPSASAEPSSSQHGSSSPETSSSAAQSAPSSSASFSATTTSSADSSASTQ